MTVGQQDKILSAFVNTPDKLLEHLITNNMLKGRNRAILSQFVLDNSNSPEMADYIWLPLLPHTLSIQSVKGCCNLKCRMCGGSNGKLEYLRADDLDKMLKQVPTVELVILVAGDSEPLMNPEMPDILRTIKKHGANSNIVTNGHLLNDKLIEAMIETQQPSSLNVSLDAAKPHTYHSIRGAELNNVVSRLQALRDAKQSANVEWPLISLLMVGMEDNIEELPEFVELASTLKASRVHVDHMHGNYSPGDFQKNPKWQDSVIDALVLGRKTGVEVQLPHDTIQIIEKKLHTIINEDMPVTNTEQPAAIKHSPAKSEHPKASPSSPDPVRKTELSVTHCPWLNFAFITMNGTILPCCDTSTKIGNIMQEPLKENLPYLKARMGNLAGKVYKDCMSTANCAYVQDIKRCGVKPTFIG